MDRLSDRTQEENRKAIQTFHHLSGGELHFPRRINREGDHSNLLTVSLGSHFNPRRTTELSGLLPPPPISQGLRGIHPHHQEENRAKASHLPTISLGFIIVINHYHHLFHFISQNVT
ncbi:hypothetical protein PIB30_072141 [Stylosanthes scabra]|uniref:Uncharacterized protein n=1 Tax=Stylosanthes scabra TaxID=79078 RepID=A0ABU6YQC4_9FABA|nr:hypothetical protein [Stylosanthes scabra]